MMENVENTARALVAAIHAAHIERVMGEELSAWASKTGGRALIIAMPTKRAVEIAQTMLEGAFKEGQGDAVRKVNVLIDAAGKKGVPVNQLLDVTAELRGDKEKKA